MAAIVKITTDGKPQTPLANKELGYDKVTNEFYVGSGTGSGDGSKLSKDAGELQVTRNAELDLHMNSTFAQHGLIPNDGVNEIRPKDMFTEVNVADVLRLSNKAKQYSVRFTDGVHSINQSDFQLPKAPFATGSTDELLDDKVNGLTTQTAHSKGDIVVTGNELIDTTSAVLTSTTETNGIYTITNSASASQVINYPTLNRILGQTYVVSYTIESISSGSLSFNVLNSGALNENTHSTPGDYTFTFTYQADAGDTGWGIYVSTAVDNAVISNFSIKLKDQSYIALQNTTAGEVIAAGEWNTRRSYEADTLVKHSNKVYKCVQSYTVYPFWNTDASYSKDNMVEYNGKVYKALQDADDTIEITNTDYWEVQRNAVEIGNANYWEYQYDLGFKHIPYVTKQVALLIEKTRTGAILNTVKPLVNMYGEESVETYESDIFSELGYSQKADRVYTDGSSEFILVGLKGYLNAGAYHPWKNCMGTSPYVSYNDTPVVNGSNKWYGLDTVTKNNMGDDSSLYGMFNLTPSNRCCGHTGAYVGNKYYASINKESTVWLGRPDLKFYDKTYIEGQGGLVCFAIPNALTPTYKHQEEVRRNLVNGYIENGVEYKVPYYLGSITVTQEYNTTGGYLTVDTVGDNSQFGSVGDYVMIAGDNGKLLVIEILTVGVMLESDNRFFIWADSVTYGSRAKISTGKCIGTFNNGSDITSNFPVGTKLFVYSANKSPYLATQGNQTHTDLIGDPAPYNSSDATYVSPTSTSVTDMPTNTLVWDNATGKMYKAIVGTNDLDANGLPVPAFTDTTAWVEAKKGYPQELRSLLASGKGVGFINPLLVGQDGSDYIDASNKTLINSKKKISQFQGLYSLNAGSSWSLNSLSPDLITNSNRFGGGFSNASIFVTYQSQNQSAVPISIPKPIQTVDRDLIATNHNNVYAYNGLTYAASGKVATGSSVESKGVDDALQDVSKNIFTTPKHTALILDNQSIVASKALLTQTSNATQVFTQELDYDSTAGDFGDDNQFDQLTSGTLTDLNGHTVQTKILLKPSSIKLGE